MHDDKGSDLKERTQAAFATATTTTFQARRTRAGQVVAVGSVADLETARREHLRITMIDPAGHRATATVYALGHTFLPAERWQPQAYGYVVDVETEEQL